MGKGYGLKRAFNKLARMLLSFMQVPCFFTVWNFTSPLLKIKKKVSWYFPTRKKFGGMKL
ncbi:MAG: hypothetical protein ACTSRP_20790 [Candidatus Helarchaeota archaeon]